VSARRSRIVKIATPTRIHIKCACATDERTGTGGGGSKPYCRWSKLMPVDVRIESVIDSMPPSSV
jgi:hypothetical protein